MLTDLQTIEQPADTYNLTIAHSAITAEEIECPTCGFSSKPVNHTEHECCNGHRFKG